jgi:2-polyprenyl-6-methoxyphenol hydroxylase-like FAD-dependent oxidoreductase
VTERQGSEHTVELNAEIVIVGGGIAGMSAASVLARDGREVTVLEASLDYEDRVRGESMLPWGVAEAEELGVLQTLIEADARLTETWVHYDPLLPTDVSLANRIPAGLMLPRVSGSLNLRHPEACEALAKLASGDGARVERGVSRVAVRRGPRPEVTAQSSTGETLELHPRLVVGADGRNSMVRRQIGIELERHQATHMISGVIVDGLDDLEIDHDFLATTDDLFMASFRQHHGQVRVYLCPGMKEKNRFAGRNGMAEFLRSANFGCLPFGDRLATANPIGPLATYPGDDTWTPQPYLHGVVLIGDAAGHNSPIIGQGLSIAMRDARSVRDAIRSGEQLPAAFAPYAAERMERMRRLRTAAIFMASMAAEDCANRVARRAKFFELQQREPLMMAMMAGMFAGPENAPAEAFDDHLHDVLVAAA